MRHVVTLGDYVALDGGEEEIRTLDPHVANVMLYQLSYFPMQKRVYYTIIGLRIASAGDR